MQNRTLRLINAILIINIGIVVFSLLTGNRLWFINAQVGFITALGVVFASLWSYRNMVNSSVNAQQHSDISKENSSISTSEEDEPKRTMMQSLRGSKAYISIYRLGAYFFLAICFAILQQKQILHIPSYFGGIFLAPLAVIVGLWRKNKGENL